MMNTFYLISHLVSTFAAESITIAEQSNKSLDSMRRKLKTGFTNHLPKIVLNGIMVNGKFAKTGTIVVRTLSKSWVTELVNEYHYGVVIGTDANGIEYIIEMTDGRNVNILTKKKFIEPHTEGHFKIYSIPEKDFVPADIYKKAERFEYSVYSILNLNCIDFSRYCVYDIEPKRRSDELNKMVLKFNEMGQKLNELYIKYPPTPEMKEF
ncbi:MAG: hypothetical protein ACXVNO_01495, partial [Bacteroidia bacterium]